MNDKHINSEGGSPEGISEDEVSSNARHERELYTSGEGLNYSSETTSYSGSPQDISNSVKTTSQGDPFNAPEKKKLKVKILA